MYQVSNIRPPGLFWNRVLRRTNVRRIEVTFESSTIHIGDLQSLGNLGWLRWSTISVNFSLTYW